MRILWITNTLFPEISEYIGIEKPLTGGWMYSSLKYFSDINPNNSFAIACIYQGSELKIINLNSKIYYLIPRKYSFSFYPKYLEKYWGNIYDHFKPDIVHIHGTEYLHVLAYINSCGVENIVISIQGLISSYANYYFGGLSSLDILKNITFRDLVKNETLFNQRNNMKKRGVFEKKSISKVKHIIGRTKYDRSIVLSINPYAVYHFNNESLREIFYKKKWDLNKCKRYSIFLSQVHYPIKGFHKMLDAFPLILREFPNSELYVLGTSIFEKKPWKRSGYEKYLLNKITGYNLKDRIHFLGKLDELKMCDQYLNSHVFVCPSSIENSSNSICEAQLLGVPVVASYVGGVADLIEDKESGFLYRFEEVEMLASAVCNLFSNDDLAKKISNNSRSLANERHDPKENVESLMKIYKNVSNL